MREYVDRRPALLGVVVVTVAALVARLLWLTERTMHFDEGRVGFRILEFGATGTWSYDAIVHGPFLFHVNELLFDLLGPSTFVARLPVAVIGGLLPATAWLLRKHLRDVEVIALAGFLAANPVLLYYSRFMRNDILVATFAFAAFGLGVRLVDTQRPRYLYAAALALALAFTAKENALIYVGTWIGALALVFDHRLFTAGAEDETARAVARRHVDRTVELGREWWVHVAIALGLFLAVIVVFFAPRPEFTRALSSPAQLPGVLGEATLGSWQEFMVTWGSGESQRHSYLPFLRDYLRTLRVGALAVVALAVVGFLVDRYAAGSSRTVVAVSGYWALASLFIYPLATDIQAAWSAVHTIVPAAVPAAVGVGLLVDRFRDALATDDAVAAGLAALLAIAIIGQVALTASTLVYAAPQSETQMVQFGQPADDFDRPLQVIEAAIEGNEGTDVFFIGLKFNNDPGTLQFDRLPWPWYLRAMGAEVDGSATLDPVQDGTPAPVIIVPADASYIGGYTESDVRPYLEEYTRIGAYAITQEIPNNVVYTVVYVRTDVLPPDVSTG